jgi:NADH-quinone oxidoreductase subunit N
MATDNLVTLLPFVVIAATAVVALLVVAFYRNHLAIMGLTLIGFVVAFITLPLVASTTSRHLTALLILDDYALFYMGLLFSASCAVALLSYGYLQRRKSNPEEFYILLLLATLGSSVLVASDHFASFFLGLEILSVSLYALIGYPRASQHNVEAGIKYLILAAASAAFLLFGMALVYAASGTMEFTRMSSLRTTSGDLHGLLVLAGLGMIIVGVGFKLAVVPFHLWTPDVYEGAPAPVTAFVATVSKGSVFALLLRYFTQLDVHVYTAVFLVLSLIAIVSMFAGNLLALLQNNVKRLLAYSSIAHLGYLVVALLASGGWAAAAVAFYLTAYFVTTLTAFGIVTVLSGHERDADALVDYQGLFWRRPLLAGIFTATLLSLAGIPLTAGFVGKFYLVAAGIESALWLLVIMLVVNSAIGLFYYLRVVAVMYMRLPEGDEIVAPVSSVSLAGRAALAVLALSLIWLGVYPAPVIDMIRKAIAAVT